MREDMKALQFLLGTWQTEGEVYATGNNAATRFNGTDSYESVLNGSYILHKVDIMMGEERVEAIEMISNNKEKPGSYLLHSFDNTGTASTMQGVVETADRIKIFDDNKSAELRPVNNDELIGEWEKLEEKNWVKWMKLTLTRI